MYSGVQQKHPIRLGSQINFDIMSSWSLVQFDDGNHPRETAFRPTSEVFEMFLKRALVKQCYLKLSTTVVLTSQRTEAAKAPHKSLE